MLVKFVQNRMVETTRNFELFDKKKKTVLPLKQLVIAKIFISRLRSFSVQKMTVV